MSDWSSCVCSSDLDAWRPCRGCQRAKTLQMANACAATFHRAIRLPDDPGSVSDQDEVRRVQGLGYFERMDQRQPHGIRARSVARSGERRDGKVSVSACRSRWSPKHKKKKNK